MMSPGRLPNFLHLGPGKAGSTWLHESLSLHPDVYLTEAKDLYYFSRYFDRGQEWYQAQFRAARPEHVVVGEVCPDYLAAPKSAERIEQTLGTAVRLMVTLRDPVDRAFSSFLYAQKHGLAASTFQATLERSPEMVEEGRYGTQLAGFVRVFGPERIHVSLFDDLERDPQSYLDATTDWLGVSRLPLDPEQLAPKLPASKARFLPVARVAQRGAQWLREHNQARLVGLVKRSSWVQESLYRPLGGDRPEISPDDAAMVKELLDDEVKRVEQMFSLPLRRLWNW
jgi:hypothetical protein